MPGDFTWVDDHDARSDVGRRARSSSTGPAPRAPDRVLATVLFTDIVGSTERAAELGDRRWRDLVERHHAPRARRARAHSRGVREDTAGDGFFATFDGPARAIACGAEVGRPRPRARHRDPRRPAHRRVRGDRRQVRRPRGHHRRPGRSARRARGGARLAHREGPHRRLGSRVRRRAASTSSRACPTAGTSTP